MKRWYIPIIMFLSIGCIRETGVIKETIIVNDSGHDISYTVYQYNRQDIIINLKNGETASEIREGYTGGAERFPLESDSIIILFDDARFDKYYNEVIQNTNKNHPFNMDAYEEKELGEQNNFIKFIYTYYITEEDFKNATPF
ncbi:MAG: hypothetical protein MI866_22240 [Bacteroidales bacterium]|nr:hypothetical protein [Bacteroidales bacterium]